MNDVDSKAFGNAVRAQRKKLGISQIDLAKSLAISPAYLCKIETGAFKPPAEKVILKMCVHLRLDGEEMLCLAGRIPSDIKRIIINDPKRVLRAIRDLAG